jgi:hypothetical protein
MGRKAARRAPLSHLSDAQQGRKGVEDGVEVGERAFDRMCPFAGRGQARLQLLAQAGERGAQVVRHVAGHLLQAFHQGADAVEHAVEGGGQPVEVVVRAAHGNPPAKVAADDRLGRPGDGRHPAMDVAAQRIAAGHAQDDDPSEGQTEAFQHHAVQHLDAVFLIANHQASPMAGPRSVCGFYHHRTKA